MITFIAQHRHAIVHAKRTIATADLPIHLKQPVIEADLVGAIILDELQRRGFEDDLQEWLPQLATLTNASLGPAQMKPSVVEDLVAAGLIVQPIHWEKKKSEIIQSWLLDPQKSAQLVAARLEHIVRHWAKGGVDISDKPQILATLYSLGLVGQAGIHDNPQANERGEKIAYELRQQIKGILTLA
ncbi:MAG: hypothetical protein SVR94_16265 [Pseudomonadota bacterium]|nr:hypothetical protein [Pseudomonadota bacterium]